MGLCISKKDVLINQKQPQLSLREQMLSSDLHLRAAHLIPSSPSASLISADSSSVAEKHLLKNSSIGSSCTILRSSVSNIAECGSIGGGFHRRSIATTTVSDDDFDDLSSTCGPRTSNFSYLSSPAIEGIDHSYGIDNITRSYHKAKERFELEGFSNFNPRLLEIDEELEDEEFPGESPESVKQQQRKKSHTKSLHVFGEILGESTPKISVIPSIPVIKTSSAISSEAKINDSNNNKSPCGLGLFGAADIRHDLFRSLPPKVPAASFKQQEQFDSDFSCSEAEAEMLQRQIQPNVRSARWGFVLDSSGSDEMEGDTTEASRLSSSSTQIEPLCRFSPQNHKSAAAAAAFMAVPPRSEVWPPNFSHMNPSSKIGAAKTEDSSVMNLNPVMGYDNPVGFLRGFPAGSLLKPKSFDFAAAATSSSSDDSSSAGTLRKNLKQVHLNLNSSSSGKFSAGDYDDDDGNDSDSSNDLFEIENLGAALGSLSSSNNKEFVYPTVINSGFLKDPDISYTTSSKAVNPAKSFQFQGYKSSSGGKILGPTLRANALYSSSSSSKQQQHKPDSNSNSQTTGRKNFSSRLLKKKSALEYDNVRFYGR